jgi:hypothetical protein
MQKGQERNLALVFIFSIITCGLYYLYLVYMLTKELNGTDTNRTSPGMTLLLFFITCGIYPLYWMYKTAERVNDLSKTYQISTDDSLPLICLLLAFFTGGTISILFIQNQANKLWKA